jgi:DNA-binding response OmpR family regulator
MLPGTTPSGWVVEVEASSHKVDAMVTDEPVLELDSVAQPRQQVRRILIVDDDRDQADTLAYALCKQGFDPLLAHTLQAGRVAVELHQPSLIIMDIRLPDGDGLSLCQQLADEPQTCQIPVIILSGMERPDIVRDARAAGCLFFLRKPYDPNALLLLARDALGLGKEW